MALAPPSTTPRGHHQHRDVYPRGEFREETWAAYSQTSSRCLFLCLRWVSEWYSVCLFRIKTVFCFHKRVTCTFSNPGLLSVQLRTDCRPHVGGGEPVDRSAHCGDRWGRSTLRCTQTRLETHAVVIRRSPCSLYSVWIQFLFDCTKENSPLSKMQGWRSLSTF